jgi:7SK snRNA methylphosphate capping enzyme
MFEGKRCLDIGCNAGELTVAIAQRYAPQHILGVDIDGSLVRRARAHLVQVAKSTSSTSSVVGVENDLQCRTINPFVFPFNCGFRRENFVDTADADATYSVIMCLSTTKWIHFNWGDDGIKRLFQRIYRSLSPGGIFILEAQVKHPLSNLFVFPYLSRLLHLT